MQKLKALQEAKDASEEALQSELEAVRAEQREAAVVAKHAEEEEMERKRQEEMIRQL